MIDLVPKNWESTMLAGRVGRLVKGADWAEDAIVGRATVEARGGRVVRVPVEQGWLTTSIVERIRKR